MLIAHDEPTMRLTVMAMADEEDTVLEAATSGKPAAFTRDQRPCLMPADIMKPKDDLLAVCSGNKAGGDT